MFKKLLSYIIPITVHKQKSSINKSIDVVMRGGRLVLDTPNTNYSYGSLQRILRLGLRKIGFSGVQKMQNILVLGLAGGSVVKTLVDEIGYKKKITAVDIDTEIVNVAKTYFNLDRINNLEIIIDDAQQFVQKTKSKYDLIIIDIFQDDMMPEFLFSQKFINQALSLLTSNGKILFNTMKNNKKQAERNADFIEFCQQTNFVKVISNVEGSNELIIISKEEK
ncbi:spermidine synthase [Capnocytophaga felis]|uniref:Spermidine synthase n=1 Tax=Capnocytophaga felis TaxID=2267611 RepID=A0A5M4B7C3_9FLAO|nr:fused MFS/spermidine synthase [Capnocytophaga felis]GET45503.1 spermidine synthase [Capnocytophaga felis]GET47334.1 spermidine synthase [Capnocytophaga felis]